MAPGQCCGHVTLECMASRRRPDIAWSGEMVGSHTGWRAPRTRPSVTSVLTFHIGEDREEQQWCSLGRLG